MLIHRQDTNITDPEFCFRKFNRNGMIPKRKPYVLPFNHSYNAYRGFYSAGTPTPTLTIARINHKEKTGFVFLGSETQKMINCDVLPPSPPE